MKEFLLKKRYNLAVLLCAAVLAAGCTYAADRKKIGAESPVSAESVISAESDHFAAAESKETGAGKSTADEETGEDGQKKGQNNVEYLYQVAVKDAMTAEPEEILPVVTLTQDSDMVTWNNAEDKVLLITMNRYPDSYPAGEEVNLEWGSLWTFTDREIKKWYDDNHEGVEDWQLRFNQLIGLPPEMDYTHFTALWVSPEDIERPAYVTDITSDTMMDQLPEDVSEEYKEWFDGNIVWSYFDSAYPWTRLGYTYDWADNGTEYGLSEFLVKQGADAEVEFTYTVDEFLKWLEE